MGKTTKKPPITNSQRAGRIFAAGIVGIGALIGALALSATGDKKSRARLVENATKTVHRIVEE